MIRSFRIVLTTVLTVCLGACATQPPTVAQGLALYDAGDYAKASEMLDKLAQAGNAQAQQALGVMYENGQGVNKDENLALNLYRQAAANNNESAQYLLGTLLESKSGLVNNQNEIIKWYRLAATNGHPSAQYKMGQLELVGTRGTAPDLLKASYWFGLAAAQGDPQAQLQYGLMLMQGRAGASDRILGYMWIDIAQGLGDNTTAQAALQAAKSLSPNELQSAKKMASQCIKQNYQSCSRLTR
jgi:TPR repeat protein